MAADTAHPDQASIADARWHARAIPRIKALITDELIDEHRQKPLGQHSDALERVLSYFRRAPQSGKYVGVCIRPWQEWRIGVLSGVRGIPPSIIEDGPYGSQDEIQHAIFLRRVHDLLQS